MATQAVENLVAARALRDPASYSRDEFVTDYELAHILKLSRSWLKQLRVSGGGPRYSKPSPKCVRYKVGDGLDWLTSRSAHSTSEMEAAA